MTPNFPSTIANLGITLTYLGQPDAAIPLLERSLDLSPHDYYVPASQAYLGLSHLLLGDAEAAVKWLRTARTSSPQLYFAYWLLAAALGLKGELDAAHEALRQAIEMRPGLVAHVVARLRRATPGYIALYEKTVYLGLRRAGLPDFWAGTNERPAGWVGSYDAESPLPVPHF
jgi:tetratricopeptide (TPR) repeat protein